MPEMLRSSSAACAAMVLTPKEKSINNKGFKPDVEVESGGIQDIYYVPLEKKETIEPDTVNSSAGTVQMFLSYLGYNADREDEYFSLQSSQALMQFQSDHDLKATGIVDYKTWKCLEKEALLRSNEREEQEDTPRQKAIMLF